MPDDQSVLEITRRGSLDSRSSYLSDYQDPSTSRECRTPTPTNQRRKSGTRTPTQFPAKRKASSKKHTKRRVVEKASIVKMNLIGKVPPPNPRRMEAEPSPLRGGLVSPTPSRLSLKQSSRELTRKLSPAQRKKLGKEEPLPTKPPSSNTIRIQLSSQPQNKSYLNITAQTTY